MGNNRQNKKILIIEDEALMLRALVDRFTEEKLTVYGAKNGREGLELALKEHPDLILLDIIMPEMDGMTMLRKLREDDWGKDVTVIVLTNLSEMKKVSEALEGEVYDFLIKSSWKLEDLVKRVKKRLSTK